MLARSGTALARFRSASNAATTQRMKMSSRVFIVGGGPAAYTAALYLARANLAPKVLTGPTPGGLLTTTKDVENFPGFPKGIEGFELTENMEQQARRFGAEIEAETIESIDLSKRPFAMKTASGLDLAADALIIATGASPRHLDIPGYQRLWNKGISTCAVCDGGLPVFRKKPLVVVGGGDSACEEALHLTHTAEHVYLVHRRDTLRASKVMADRVLNHAKITMIWDSEVAEVFGEKKLEGVKIRNFKSNEVKELPVAGLFVAIGHDPNVGFLKGQLALDEGFIKTERDMSTSVPGVWAAGDVQDRNYRQAITAAGSGCMAALEAERFLSREGAH